MQMEIANLAFFTTVRNKIPLHIVQPKLFPIANVELSPPF